AQRAAQARAAFQGALPGRLDRRAIRHRVGERHADLDEIGPGLGEPLEEGERGIGVRVAGGQIDDEPGAALLAQFGEPALDAAHGRCPEATPSSPGPVHQSPCPGLSRTSTSSMLRQRKTWMPGSSPATGYPWS